ncbi:acyltransferase family protein [Pantoea sp.]|uniref:acyltransferase family protein n=1 Tax=Pantoea sp. TaxID=69393 RepID=UPI0028979579|nr:acyltransferase family protein [Pantoea sp.]
MRANADKDVLWINTLKGGSILLVVLHHTMITTFMPSVAFLSAGTLPAEIWIAFNKYLSPLRMPAFFFVSGLLAASAISKKSWRDIFTKKVSNIVYLYLLWGTIQWLCISGFSLNVIGEKLSTAKNAAYAASLPEFIKLLMLSMTSLWYLYALVGYFLLSKLFHRQKLALLVLAVLANYAAQLNLVPGWGPTSVAQNYLWFLSGAFFSAVLITLSQCERRHLWLLAAVALMGVIHHALGIYKNPFYSLLAIVGGILFCRMLNQRLNMAWLNWIGRHTLPIYVLHRIYIEVLGLSTLLTARHYHWFSSRWFSLSWALLLPVVAVSLCTLLSLLTWSLLNRGPGRALFIYPRLLRKPPIAPTATPVP